MLFRRWRNPITGARPNRDAEQPTNDTRRAWSPSRQMPTFGTTEIITEQDVADQYRERFFEIFGTNDKIDLNVFNEETCLKYATEIDWAWVGRHFLDRRGSQQYEKIYDDFYTFCESTVEKASKDLERRNEQIQREFAQRCYEAERRRDESNLSGRYPDRTAAFAQWIEDVQNAAADWVNQRARLFEEYLENVDEAHNEFVLTAARAFAQMALTNLKQPMTIDRDTMSI